MSFPTRTAYETMVYRLTQDYPQVNSTTHHRHEPPEIKHNRRPAPGISFDAPNLATLITDCIDLGARLMSNDPNRVG